MTTYALRTLYETTNLGFSTEGALCSGSTAAYLVRERELPYSTHNITKAAEHWDNRYRGRPPVHVPWYEARIAKRREEMRTLRGSVECAYEGEQRATAWAQRERNRAEAAEAESPARRRLLVCRQLPLVTRRYGKRTETLSTGRAARPS
jgi:hypothetical protein